MSTSTPLFNVTLNATPGYQLSFVSWENDGDDYRTTVVQGLSKEDAAFYIAVANLFDSKNAHRGSGMGNQSTSDEELQDAIAEVLEQHPNVSDSTRFAWYEEFGSAHSGLYNQLCDEILSHPVQYDEHNFCRVFERVEVHLISQPIVDVTYQFK